MRASKRLVWGLLIFVLAACATAVGAELRDETVDAWNRYIRLTEERIERELLSRRGFLALDFQSPTEARSDRSAALDGEVRVREVATLQPDGSSVPVPEGWIHHWRGTVFLPGVTLEKLLNGIQAFDSESCRQEDLLEARVLSREKDSIHVYLKLVRTKIVTVTYNTEHLVRYRRHGPGRVSSRSVALRIAELEEAGTPSEREKAVGRDSGFLWRLNSYWRYEELADGVLVECESVSLSRSAPLLLKGFVQPIVRSVARESMIRTLHSLRDCRRWARGDSATLQSGAQAAAKGAMIASFGGATRVRTAGPAHAASRRMREEISRTMFLSH